MTGIKHEKLTRDIISDPSTQVHQKLRKFSSKLPNELAWFFDEEAESDVPPGGLPAYLTQVISSQLDADRCDYLLRDSHATGTDYGRYDLDWLLSHVQPQEDGRRFYLTRKALSATEAYVFARFRMYRTVYFHKTTRSAEVMFKLLFQRVQEKLGGSPTLDEAHRFLPDLPRSVLAVLTGQLSLDWYTRIDEHSITEFLKACSDAADPILKELGGGLVHRELFKVIDVTDAPRARVGSFTAAVHEHLQGEQLRDYCFIDDSPADTHYEPYDPDVAKPTEQIYVENAAGQPREISELSRTVAQLREQHELVRYYFPERLRPGIEAIAKKKLKKE